MIRLPVPNVCTANIDGTAGRTALFELRFVLVKAETPACATAANPEHATAAIKTIELATFAARAKTFDCIALIIFSSKMVSQRAQKAALLLSDTDIHLFVHIETVNREIVPIVSPATPYLPDINNYFG